MAKIIAIKSREILDSRGLPTIETTIWSDNNHGSVASIPSGASIGRYEAVELRDNDQSRFNGKGVLKAVANVNEIIAPRLINLDPIKQNEIDQILINLDNTANKSRLGANAILSVSQAICELGAIVSSMQTFEYLAAKYQLHTPAAINLPTPIFNLINGGKHATGNLDFQEFHLIPTSKIPFSQALSLGETVYHKLGEILESKEAPTATGDEGGYAPNLQSNQDAIELLLEAVRDCQLTLGQQVFIGLDAAAGTFFKASKYQIKDQEEFLSPEELINFFTQLKKEYNLYSLEDPLQPDDWNGWANITSSLGQDTMIIGDDLLATNKKRLQKAIKNKACNAIIIKPNQIGTISETVSVVKLAKASKFSTIVSHRSGDTNEDFIADFAVGLGAEYAKFGAPARGERVVKYNRLSLIESYLKAKPANAHP